MTSHFLKAIVRVAATVLLSFVAMQPAAHSSGLQSQLNGLFDSMANVTEPGVFETQRRGVISGGRATVKNRLFTESIVSFSPPSWKAGCGGIDLFGGAFSFINSEQLTQLLRAVAANAAGYAFQLAIKITCEMCATVLETLQKKIQELNQFMGNSCQLAQGIVNDVSSAFNFTEKTHDKHQASVKGFVEDFFSSWSEPKGESATAAVAQNAPELLRTGNIVWMQLQRSNAANWFRVKGDNNLLEAIMSITGSVIIHEPTNDDRDTQPVTELPGNKISLEDIVMGGKVSIYSCAFDYTTCEKAGEGGVGTREEDLIGIKTQIEAAFLGNSGLPGDGLVGKYATDSGTLTASERAISASLPLGIGTLIFNLATSSEDVARSFVYQVSGALATQMAYSMALESLRVAQAALAGEESAYVVKVRTMLESSRRTIESQHIALQSKYGRLSDFVQLYNGIQANVRKSQYMPIRTLPGL